MKRPKKLYRYDMCKSGKKKPDVHELSPDCCPQVVMETSFGILFRCRDRGHDFCGYGKLSEARSEERVNTAQRISEDQEWYKELGGY